MKGDTVSLYMKTWRLSHVIKSKTARTIAAFAGGNVTAMLIGVIGSFAQARYIGPEEMGVFRTFSIISGYLTFLHLGVFDGLQREIPIQLGKGNREKAEQAASACLTWILFISIAASLGFFIMGLKEAYDYQWGKSFGWLAFIPFIIATFYGGYLGTTFRTGQQFIRLSKVSVLQAAAGVLILPLLPFWGYYAACLRTAVTSTTNILFLHKWRPFKIRPKLDWAGFRNVIRVGLPLSGIGYVYVSLWNSLEGTFVLMWFGTKGLGLYSIAMFIRGVVVLLAQNMNQVINVKIYEQYGRTGKVHDCVQIIIQPMIFGLVASIPFLIIAWLLIPDVVSLLVPKYVEAVPMVQIVLVMMCITFMSLPITILWATGRIGDCFGSIAAGFLTFIGSSYLFYHLNFGALGILVASIIGQMVNILMSYFFIYRLVHQEKTTIN